MKLSVANSNLRLKYLAAITIFLLAYLFCFHSSPNNIKELYVHEHEIKGKNIQKENSSIIINLLEKDNYLIRIKGKYLADLPASCKVIFNKKHTSTFLLTQQQFQKEIIVKNELVEKGRNTLELDFGKNSSNIVIYEINIKNIRGYNGHFPRLIVAFGSSSNFLNNLLIIKNVFTPILSLLITCLFVTALFYLFMIAIRPLWEYRNYSIAIQLKVELLSIIPVISISVMTLVTTFISSYYIVWDLLDILMLTFAPMLIISFFIGNEFLKQKLNKSIIKYIFLITVIVVPKIIGFQPLLAEWDGGEYALSIRNSVLPHSPYIIYIWFGKFFSLFCSPDKALSLLAVTSSSLASLSLFFIIKKLYKEETLAFLSVIIFNYTPVNINFSVIQDTYPMQIGFLSLAALGLVFNSNRSIFLSGLFFGMALGTHNSTICVGPFLLYFLLSQKQNKRLKSIVIWLIGITIPFGSSIIWSFSRYMKLFGPLEEAYKNWIIYYTKSQIPPFDYKRLLILSSYIDIPIYFAIIKSLAKLIGNFPLILGALCLIFSFKNRFMLKNIFIWVLWFLPYFLLYDLPTKNGTPKPHIYLVQYAIPFSVLGAFGIKKLLGFTKLSNSLGVITLVCVISIILSTDGIRNLIITRKNLAQGNHPYQLIDKYLPKDIYVVVSNNPNTNAYYANRRQIFAPNSEEGAGVYISSYGIWDTHKWQNFTHESFTEFIKKHTVITLNGEKILYEHKPIFFQMLNEYKLYKY